MIPYLQLLFVIYVGLLNKINICYFDNFIVKLLCLLILCWLIINGYKEHSILFIVAIIASQLEMNRCHSLLSFKHLEEDIYNQLGKISESTNTEHFIQKKTTPFSCDEILKQCYDDSNDLEFRENMCRKDYSDISRRSMELPETGRDYKKNNCEKYIRYCLNKNRNFELPRETCNAFRLINKCMQFGDQNLVDKLCDRNFKQNDAIPVPGPFVSETYDCNSFDYSKCPNYIAHQMNTNPMLVKDGKLNYKPLACPAVSSGTNQDANVKIESINAFPSPPLLPKK